jgi:hypothetical protein
MNDNEKIVNKIKALLAMAEDQHGLPEGEVAAKIAEKLMREHAIEMHHLQEKEVIIQITQEVGRSNWTRNLLHQVAIFCSCKMWIITGTRNVGIAGHSADLEVCEYLFDLIRLQIENKCEQFMKSEKRKDSFNPFSSTLPSSASNGSGKGSANDFKMSAVAGVADKLRKIKSVNNGAENRDSNALVLSRYNAVNDWVNSQMRLRNRSASNYSHNASGYQAGQNVRLSNGIGSKGTPAGIGISPRQLKG